MQTSPQQAWLPATQAWLGFVQTHPELGYPPSRWGFHNFIRHHRQALKSQDAIRMVRNRHWIAHQDRFNACAFDLATGVSSVVIEGGEHAHPQ
jgi:hypothetical protein